MEKSIQNIEFISEGFWLKGVLHLPAIEKPPLVVGSHGLEGSKESAKQKVLARLLVENGMAFFRFDHRGCGQSQGDFVKDTSLEKRTMDYLSAIQHILSLNKTSRDIALFGSSMGGATCINAWERLSLMDIRLSGAILCSSPVRSRSVVNIPTKANENRPALPLSFFKENLLFDILDKISDLSNVLIFHGDADKTVPVSNAHELFNRANEPKRLIIQKGGDHQMTSEKDQGEFEAEALAWYLRCFRHTRKMTP
ncbi:MAG: damage-inducible protein CinA [Desulfobacterales bacterium RIFOXYA12_FULL_46_15]|nr:MAG: damage-inducible protein CinA [Desulfobacula sp. GWF2_41_7]OGR23189.1 MAG: damage-inducible protein CinA [Desulfobacterales bacterium RIFOXYA12_FULL_46_15]